MNSLCPEPDAGALRCRHAPAAMTSAGEGDMPATHARATRGDAV